ncbi:hypothetical protein GGX14DRAFT_578206 [Mycena pura]|uniref:Uncharacterized protein n=1 Tax=Mycena pura TaxID=153505 RepID=A0AAD6Y1K0_9AGAR|nr:hypothetical protein GGX14DRAFT_578206 [Mycena pura]
MQAQPRPCPYLPAASKSAQPQRLLPIALLPAVLLLLPVLFKMSCPLQDVVFSSKCRVLVKAHEAALKISRHSLIFKDQSSIKGHDIVEAITVCSVLTHASLPPCSPLPALVLAAQIGKKLFVRSFHGSRSITDHRWPSRGLRLSVERSPSLSTSSESTACGSPLYYQAASPSIPDLAIDLDPGERAYRHYREKLRTATDLAQPVRALLQCGVVRYEFMLHIAAVRLAPHALCGTEVFIVCLRAAALGMFGTHWLGDDGPWRRGARGACEYLTSHGVNLASLMGLLFRYGVLRMCDVYHCVRALRIIHEWAAAFTACVIDVATMDAATSVGADGNAADADEY